MKTYKDYSDIPARAAYLGGEDGAGTIDETTAFNLDFATDPVCLVDEDGARHFFDLKGSKNEKQ